MRLFDVSCPAAISAFQVGHQRADMASISFSPDGRHVISCGEDDRAFVFDLRHTTRPVHCLKHDTSASTIDNYGITRSIWSRSGGRVWTGGSDGLIKEWNIAQSDPFVHAIGPGDGAVGT